MAGHSKTISLSPTRRPREEKERSNKHKSKHDDEDRHRKHKHHRDRDETEAERAERKRSRKGKGKDKSKRGDAVEQEEDEGEWVEKGAEASSNVPTSDALHLHSNPSHPKKALPGGTSTISHYNERESWMLEPTPTNTTLPDPNPSIPHSIFPPSTSTPGKSDPLNFFSSMGTEHKRKDPNADKPDPTKPVFDKRELNRQLVEGKTLDEYETPKESKKVVPGGPGSSWRMMKLRRLYEQAEEQSREIEDVAMERYGNMEDFNLALEERRILDLRESKRQDRRSGPGGNNTGFPSPASTSGMRTPGTGERRYMFTSTSDEPGGGSRPGSRAGFRRPGEVEGNGMGGGGVTPGSRLDELKRGGSYSASGSGSTSGTPRTGNTGLPGKSGTPIPSVFTPTGLGRTSSYLSSVPPTQPPPSNSIPNTSGQTSTPALSTEQLNKLQAKVLRAKLMDDPNAENLEAEYEFEMERSERLGASGDGGEGMWEGRGGGDGLQGQLGREEEVGRDGKRVEVQVLPTLDGRGRLYDVGTGRQEVEVPQGNKRKKPEKFETRDREGNLLRYNADDDDQSLGELVRQERFGAGAGDQKNIDAELASAITRDAKFNDDLEYMDDNADRLARRKMKTDALKRAFAVNDYARTKKALDTCPFCYQDERPPQTAIVALGTRTYLCCTTTEELVDGHCYIVPIQHCLSSLEMEDDDWEEVRNFMKCLMQMFAKENKGVIFYETILSFKKQQHTVIECVPMPAEQFQDAPAYFKESILASESEWSQHKKLIDFSLRPGGFRRALVSNLPYFMVFWDYKGEKGYGHVIEGMDDAAGRGEGEDDMGVGVGEGEKNGGGGEFPKYFAAEIIGNILGLDQRKWRKPRRMDYALNKERARALGTKFQPYNWTLQLEEQG